jgi:hypothetical protein
MDSSFKVRGYGIPLRDSPFKTDCKASGVVLPRQAPIAIGKEGFESGRLAKGRIAFEIW